MCLNYIAKILTKRMTLAMDWDALGNLMLETTGERQLKNCNSAQLRVVHAHLLERCERLNPPTHVSDEEAAEVLGL